MNRIKNTTLADDLFICLASVLASSLYYFENRIILHNVGNEMALNTIIKFAVCFLMIFIWLSISFKSGIQRRTSFGVFSLCVWVIAAVVFLLLNKYDTGIYSSELSMHFFTILSFICNMFVYSLKLLYDTFFKIFSISETMFICGFAVLNSLVYIFGRIFADKNNNVKDIEIENE